MAQPHSSAEQTPRERVLDRRAEALDDSAIDLHEHDWGTWAGEDGADREGDQKNALDVDGDQLDREERAALRRVAGLSTELEDVTEVEYRQLRLERVVLASVWEDNGQNTLEDAENSLRELAALAETAGSTVLDGVIQRRLKPDAATYLGSGKAAQLRDIVAAHERVGDVVRKLEPLMLLECFQAAGSTCPVSGCCLLESVLRSATYAFLEVLDAERRQLEAQDRLSLGRTEAANWLVLVYRADGGSRF